MAETITVTQQAQNDGKTYNSSFDISVGQIVKYSEVIVADATDQVVAMTIDFSQLKYLYMYAATALQLETNAVDAVGGDTISLLAGEAIEWVSGHGITCPFTADVTVGYFTEAGSVDTTFIALFGIDPTV